jgi:UDPglucose 6-dehydrogenase
LGDGGFDNKYLVEALDFVAQAVDDREYLFIIASTVTPGSCEKVLLPVIQKYCPRGELVYKPELIALGSVIKDLEHPDIAVFGASDVRTARKAFNLYTCMQKADAHLMTLIEAELAKISLNCAVTMKISFANQVGMLAERLGANPHVIMDFIGRDSRIGRKCLRPGMPYGGPCFPRDNRMFQHVANRTGMKAELAVATDLINQDIFADLLNAVPFEGDVGILGLAYKAGTHITEEAAGTKLRLALQGLGRKVLAHDPLIPSDRIVDVLACQTVIITTDCEQFRGLEFPESTIVIDPLAVIKEKRAATV